MQHAGLKYVFEKMFKLMTNLVGGAQINNVQRKM